jgi:hypothetical protein
MPNDHHQNTSRRQPYLAQHPGWEFVACSICLRVLRNEGWTDAGAVIRDLRTFDRDTVAHLRDGLCDVCKAELWLRRREAATPLAA